MLPRLGPYTNIDHNPLTATETVSFVPGRRSPQLTVGWSAFHCADPAAPGTFRFTVGDQVEAMEITPGSCGPRGAPHSLLEPFPIHVPNAVGIAPTLDDHGYRTVTDTGIFTSEGNATSFTRVVTTNDDVVGVQTAPTADGAWIVASDGGVFAFGDAEFHGSLGSVRLNARVVGMAAMPDGHGYWLVAADGGVFAFGDAAFHGSLGSVRLNAPVVGMAAGPHVGYWLVTSDGGVFTFGGVPFEGSAGRVRLNAPISGMASTSTGTGYWLVGSDNGIFAFGDAGFFGSKPFMD